MQQQQPPTEKTNGGNKHNNNNNFLAIVSAFEHTSHTTILLAYFLNNINIL
jgi:hypothetical protein